MKTFDKKDIFTVLNAADAEEYIDTVGFFAESLSDLQKNVTEGITDTLRAVDTDNVWSFTSDNDSFPLFLPASKVAPSYRPFKSAQEFIDIALEGNRDGWLCMRHKANGKEGTKTNEWNRKLQEYSPTQKQVSFGQQLNFSFEALFLKWEWKDSEGNWRIFGVDSED
jgi:hypothetical protein